MNIIVRNSDQRPIYEQIYAQIKSAILNGELKVGDMLPSIRGLAKDLRISVITTKRAYDELERDGYIYTVAAKGCYVSEKNLDLIRETHLCEIERHMRAICELAALCGLNKDQLLEMQRTIENEEISDESSH